MRRPASLLGPQRLDHRIHAAALATEINSALGSRRQAAPSRYSAILSEAFSKSPTCTNVPIIIADDRPHSAKGAPGGRLPGVSTRAGPLLPNDHKWKGFKAGRPAFQFGRAGRFQRPRSIVIFGHRVGFEREARVKRTIPVLLHVVAVIGALLCKVQLAQSEDSMRAAPAATHRNP